MKKCDSQKLSLFFIDNFLLEFPFYTTYNYQAKEDLYNVAF
jgi:hypothetical protein